MRTPGIYSANELRTWDVQREGTNGLWTQARPEPEPGFNLLWRLEMAWKVFTGKYDALVWTGND